MSKTGVGVMLNMLLGDDETADVVKSVLGKKIVSLKLVHTEDGGGRWESPSESLLVTVAVDDTGGPYRQHTRTIKLYDSGQSCCESRYMRTDDDLEDFVGATLVDIELRDVAPIPDDYDCHDIQFLVLKTSKGDATFSNHNVHNGYYGGFYVRAVRVEDAG